MLDSCDIQSYSNAIVMIIAALFTGLRMSRCTKIETICFKCKRDVVVNEHENNV
jgi:hypothetical protein